jgi:hypothetical protein
MNMYRRKKEKAVFKYDCTITGKSFKRTEKAQSPNDLVSVQAYYDLNPTLDDRPLVVKKQLGLDTPAPTTTGKES